MRINRWVILSMLGILVVSSVYAAKKTPPGQHVGTYIVKAGGYYSGDGTASVGKNKKISLNVSIETDDGAKGTLTAKNLKLNSNHFSGNGSVLGKQIDLTGRLDVPDGIGEEVEAARFVCTFECVDGHRGRIVGYLDVSAP